MMIVCLVCGSWNGVDVNITSSRVVHGRELPFLILSESVRFLLLSCGKGLDEVMINVLDDFYIFMIGCKSSHRNLRHYSGD